MPAHCLSVDAYSQKWRLPKITAGCGYELLGAAVRVGEDIGVGQEADIGMTDPIAEYLKQGGTINRCPTASLVESSAVPTETDKERLAEYRAARQQAVVFRWGHQKQNKAGK